MTKSAGELANEIELKLKDPCGEYIISALEGSVIIPALRAVQPQMHSDGRVATPEGWRLVPSEATPDMVRAAPWVAGVRRGWTRMLAAAPAFPSKARDTLKQLIQEYARDLRRNSSGGDNYDWETMTAIADYLETLIRRSELPLQESKP
jgi:hypothetical protein